MDVAYLRQLLEQVAEKKTNIDEALTELKKLPYEDIGYANIDQHRNLRTGQGEVIFWTGQDTGADRRDRQSYEKRK